MPVENGPYRLNDLPHGLVELRFPGLRASTRSMNSAIDSATVAPFVSAVAFGLPGGLVRYSTHPTRYTSCRLRGRLFLHSLGERRQ